MERLELLARARWWVVLAAMLPAGHALGDVGFRPDYRPVASPDGQAWLAHQAEVSCQLPEHGFEIGRFEVTNIEYAAFLNATASADDRYGLYSPLQSEHFWGGIARRRVGDRFVYETKAGYGTRPATFVSWHDAMRFANWLHYGRPVSGAEELGTTEGTKLEGAYDTSQLSPGAAGTRRNVGARYFIPTCGEWLVAGFWDPAAQRFSTYVAGDDAPPSAAPDATARSANFYDGSWALPFPHLASVDQYLGNTSRLSTLNQAGNVMEWVETVQGRNQMALGGSLFMPADTLKITYRDSELPNQKLSSFGFRVARASTLHDQREAITTAAVAGPPPERPHPTTSVPSSVSPTWTLIDHPGNTSDSRTGFGCVPYSFELAQTEITNEQYADFLNAVASDADEHELYRRDMTTGVAGGIVKDASGGRSRYLVKPGFESRPAAYLSWFAVARLANWYHFHRPKGHQVLGVTEGDARAGAYDTRGFDHFALHGREMRVERTRFTRNAGALYFIPNQDEWYKAAYYDPERHGTLKYWSYPNRSDSAPGNAAGLHGGANYQTTGLGEGAPYYVSAAGSFEATGYFPLHDMGGNLWEWLESWRGFGGEGGWRGDIPTKALRGGSFNYIDVGLSYRNTDPGFPGDSYFVYGGRLAKRVEVNGAVSAWCLPTTVRTAASAEFAVLIANAKRLLTQSTDAR